jgi:hypothetical protein
VGGYRDQGYLTDVWVTKWQSGLYTSRMAYNENFKDIDPPVTFAWLWKAKCMPKIKFFMWLLLVDRLNTRGMLLRRNMHLEEGYCCALCPLPVTETSLHLFFECSASVSRWYSIGIQWNIQQDVEQMILQQKNKFAGPFFLDLVMIAAWSIWKERNEYIFNHKPPSLNGWKRIFKTEVNLYLFRLPQHKRFLVMAWLNQI